VVFALHLHTHIHILLLTMPPRKRPSWGKPPSSAVKPHPHPTDPLSTTSSGNRLNPSDDNGNTAHFFDFLPPGILDSSQPSAPIGPSPESEPQPSAPTGPSFFDLLPSGILDSSQPSALTGPSLESGPQLSAPTGPPSDSGPSSLVSQFSISEV
jgi:hypothetical protein